METVTVEIVNRKAIKLLRELEELQIIRICSPGKTSSSKNKASRYRGHLKASTANRLLKDVEESRNEWEERFPTK